MEAFTLLETIVVVAIIGLVLPAIFSIIFIILQQQVKVLRLQQVKKEGDFAMSLMEYTIRNNAAKIYNDNDFTLPDNEVCKAKDSTYNYPINYPINNQIYFKDKNFPTTDYWFSYILDNEIISSYSGIVDPQNLTTSKVIVSDFEISCDRTGLFSPPTVAIKFTVCYRISPALGCNSSRPEDTASITYNSRVKLSSY